MAVYPINLLQQNQPTTVFRISDKYLPYVILAVNPAVGLVNLSSQVKTAFTTSGTLNKTVNRFGEAYEFSSSYFDVGVIQSRLVRQVSIISIVDITAAGSYPCIVSGNNGSTDILEFRLFDNLGRPQLSTRNSNTGYVEATGSNSIVGAGPVCLLGNYTNAACQIWQNGSRLASVSNAAADPLAWGTHQWRVGNRAVTGGSQLTGKTNLVVVLSKGLSDTEAQSLSLNPWQIFEDPFAAWYYTATGGGGVSGTLAATLGDTTSAISGTSAVLGTVAQTLSAVASAIAGTTTVLGALSLNLSATTLAASGSVGSPVSGTVTETLANTTLSASGTTTIRGTISQTLANTTLSAAGTTNILGTVNNTLGNTTLAASGSVGGAVAGTVGLTLANTTLAASGNITLVGTVNYTLENTVLAAQGTTAVLGTLGVTLGNTTLVATGTSGSVTVGAAYRFLKLWLSKLGV